MARPKLYDRQNQQQIRFRVEEEVYEFFKNYCYENKVTTQSLFETLAEDFMNGKQTKEKEGFTRLPLEILVGGELSAVAVRLISIFSMLNQAGHDVNSENISKFFDENKETLNKGLLELFEKGYIAKDKQTNNYVLNL
ncbi:hypothetical protein ABEX78_32155 [Priestia megaterium]